ncbi:hypothetical protein O181_035806 [Austropuccinia psidii MF-1]|uniref:Integrase catalytic domain-containing protein n=1 Tax=Austropuccinia psidii MF-1 TaxID=1389203 RepID=A0A9Q3H9B1_9BASI|nr:hypothetical protein [Austropuccinia psidii MF-1]
MSMCVMPYPEHFYHWDNCYVPTTRLNSQVLFSILSLHRQIYIPPGSTTSVGHVTDDRVKTFLKHFVPTFNIKTWKPFFCKQCAKRKGALRCPDLGKSIIKYDKVLDLVVSDVIRQITANNTTMRYFVTLRDHKSTFVLSRPIVSRNYVVLTLKQWLEFFKTNKGSYPKFLQTGNAKEYFSTVLTNVCSERGIQAVPVIAYTPTNNGEAEQLNRTIDEAACTMLHSRSLPEKFWPYAYQVATYLHNRLPNKCNKDSTPLEAMFNVQPSSSTLYQFGTKAIIQIPAPTAPKLALGYSNKMKIDNLLNSISMKLGQVPTNELIDQKQRTIENTKMVPDMTLPNNIKDALTSRESTEWLLAAKNELKQFYKLNVWTAIDAQPKIKVLGARWVFALKRDSKGNIIKYKAQYVVKGFTQRPGQDFGDFYAPRAFLVTLQLILALKVQQNLDMTTFDVSGAYLHIPIEEEIYVKAPIELWPELKGKVMELNKALYGTRKAARCWWLFFKSIMSGIGLDEIEIEVSLSLLSVVISSMEKQLEVKWNHQPDKIVGINMKMFDDEILLDQKVLASQIVEWYPRKVITQSTPLLLQQPDPSDKDITNVTTFQHFI